jgi:protein gp37
MRRNRRIYWDKTWNVVGGCLPVSPGCDNCYAARLAGGQQTSHDIALYLNTTNRTKDGRYVFNGKVTVLADGHGTWTRPLELPDADQPVLGAGRPLLIFRR